MPEHSQEAPSLFRLVGADERQQEEIGLLMPWDTFAPPLQVSALKERIRVNVAWRRATSSIARPSLLRHAKSLPLDGLRAVKRFLFRIWARGARGLWRRVTRWRPGQTGGKA